MNSFKFAYLTLALYILIVGMQRFKKEKLKTAIISIIIVSACLTVGARIVYYIQSSSKDLEILFSWDLSGFKISGCLFGGLVGILILMKIFKEEKRNILNTVIEGMFLCGGVAKVGCFINGCCIGKPTVLPWGVSYPEHGWYDLHPVQLYEAFTLWIGLIVLLELKDIVKDNTRISIAILVYFILRIFVIEGLYSGGQFMGNTKMRIIYFISMLVCVFFIIKDKKEIVKYGKAKEE